MKLNSRYVKYKRKEDSTLSDFTFYLKMKRLQQGFQQKDIAKKLKISPSSYSNKERQNQEFTLRELRCLKKYLKIGDKELLENFFAN